MKFAIHLAVGLALSLSACGENGPATDGQSQTLESIDEFATGEGLIANRDALPGAAIFADNCASCHIGNVPKAPHMQWLEMMAPRTIVNALTSGVMTKQGSTLTDDQKLRVAEYITRQDLSKGLPIAKYAEQCTGKAAQFDRNSAPAKIGWGHDTKRFVPVSAGGVTEADIGNLELKWAYAFPNATKARSQPAIGYGAAYVGSDDGHVYAFDLETGCARWMFKASAEVRTAVVIADGERPMVYFGDLVAKLYGVDALTGKLVWSRRMDEHPSATLTGTPLFHDGRLFVPVSSLEVVPAADPKYPCCTFRGHLDAIDGKTGKLIWQHFAIPNPAKSNGKDANGNETFAPSGAPMWTSPTLDTKRGVIYAGSGENYSSPADENSDSIFAISISTGKRLWHRQTIKGDAWNVACMMKGNSNCPKENGPDFDHSSSMLLVDLPGGKQILVAAHKNGSVYGLDPDRQGRLLWETKVGRGSIQGGVHWGASVDGTTLFVPINDMNNTRNGQKLDPKLAKPGMHAIDLRSGKLIWSKVQVNVCGAKRPFCDPGISAAVTAIPGAVLAGHMDGHMRAYASRDGKLLWDVDTAKEYATVNGMKGRGGSMSGPGAAVGGGYVVFNSGYGLYYHEPGNLFLVYRKKGK